MSEKNDRLLVLEQRQNELQQRLDAIKKDFGHGLSADSEERATELENAEVLNEITRVTAEELNQVEAEIRELKR
ncbi:MAG: hypothetical protein Tsb002_33380 [Wenzhouxiangellaceae bacterium]